MVSEAATDTTQLPALTHRRSVVLCFPDTPDKLPNNAVVWHKLSQNVHSEETKHTVKLFL